MAVARARIRISLYRRICGNRHWSWVAFVSVRGEVDVRQTLRSAYDNVGNSDIRTLILPCAEIWVQHNRRADEIDDGRRVRVHWRTGNIGVPEIRTSKGTKSIQACARACA